MPEQLLGYQSKMHIFYDKDASKALGKDFWRVTKGFRYYLGEKGSNFFVDVPAGYLTDGASVPRLFHGIINPWGDHGQDAALHDFLCEWLTIKERIKVDGTEQIITRRITREKCDNIFLEAMEVSGVSKPKRNVMFWAVSSFRIFGRVRAPSLSVKKIALEINWRKENGFDEPMFL